MTTKIMQWIEHLPEVGEAICKRRAAIAEMATHIECKYQHRPEKGYWLMTLGISPDFCVSAQGVWAYMQAHAIIDDFGTLCIVRNFE